MDQVISCGRVRKSKSLWPEKLLDLEKDITDVNRKYKKTGLDRECPRLGHRRQSLGSEFTLLKEFQYGQKYPGISMMTMHCHLLKDA